MSLEELDCKEADDRIRVSKRGFHGAGTHRGKESRKAACEAKLSNTSKRVR